MKSEILNFSEKNSVDILYNDKDIMICSIDLFYVNEDEFDCNRNNCHISMECAKKSLETFKNKPIIFRYNSDNAVFVTDVTEHSSNAKEEFNTRIAGHIPPDSRIRFLKRENGKTYCNVEAIIHKRYVPNLSKILKDRNGEMKISIEIKANGKTKNNGIYYIDEMILEGVCLLGEKVKEGIEGSHLEVVKFSQSEINQFNEKYLIFTKQDKDIFSKIKEYSMNEYGKGEEIKVDKSPQNMSYDEWGDVDKIELRKKVLDAKNYKTLVNDVYMQVEDGWEEAPSEKLKYPVMQIKDNVAVYNRYGLASALAYAKAENNTKVVNKVEELYKTIDIDKEGKESKMAEEDLVNKLDKDNPELEKIKDDADSMEDNEKEKLKNAEVVDKPEEDKLHDDIDSDKDYWKKKFEELEISHNSCMEEFNACKEELETYKTKLNACEEELNTCKNSLEKYKRNEDVEFMKGYLNTYKKCFNDEDYEILAKAIENSQIAEFEKLVDDKVKEFAKNLINKEETININNSLNGNIINPNIYVDKKKTKKSNVFDEIRDINNKY